MKVTGIIAEYNPFHNGHAYQIAQARRLTGADCIIVAMSGNFLQRGVPAIVDKYTRAEAALSAGADLVLELPAVWATASAEYFASAGVALLSGTGVTDCICYGAETAQSSLIRDVAGALSCPDDASQNKLRSLVRSGMSYPAARQQYACGMLPQYPREEIENFLTSPNNILAVEYEKAISAVNTSADRQLTGCPITRIGDGYHDTAVRSPYASATAIRRLLLDAGTDHSRALAALLPDISRQLLEKAATSSLLMDTDDFSGALYAQLLAHRADGYEAFADCSAALSNRIASQLDNYTGFASFAQLLKTKELTYTRISRVLTHILLGITKADYERASGTLPYLRVLGFRRSSQALLAAISKKASAPLVTKVADASHILSDSAMQMLTKDICAADLYRGICQLKSRQPQRTEYTRRFPIIP